MPFGFSFYQMSTYYLSMVHFVTWTSIYRLQTVEIHRWNVQNITEIQNNNPLLRFLYSIYGIHMISSRWCYYSKNEENEWIKQLSIHLFDKHVFRSLKKPFKMLKLDNSYLWYVFRAMFYYSFGRNLAQREKAVQQFHEQNENDI